MVKIQKDKVIFSRDTWEELRNNPVYTELIDDIEDRMDLEKAKDENEQSGNVLKSFDIYDKNRMRRINKLKNNSSQKLKKE